MSLAKRINPAFIGAFVLLAAALAVAAVLYYGADKYRGETVHSVAYFRSQTHGLDVGAPVVVQGVKIGNVTKIDVGYFDQAKSFYVRVEFVTSGASVLWPEQDREKYAPNSPEFLRKMIGLGFRARLASQSLVTGKLMIELGFFPNTPVNLYTQMDSEIPTIPSPAQRLWDELSQVDVAGFAKSLENVLGGLERIIAQVDVQQVQDGLNTNLAALRQLITQADQLVAHLQADIGPVMGGINQATGKITALADNIDHQVQPLAKDTRELVQSLTKAVQSADRALAGVQQLLAEGAPLQTELVSALGDVSDAARSLRQFADYLERHPESLVVGKKQ